MTIPASPSVETTTQLIVPPAALQHVLRLVSEGDTVQVARSGNHLGFRTEKNEVFTRLIEGTYPNYEQVIPKDNDKFATVDRKAFDSAVRRVAAVASEQTHRIRLKLDGNRMELNVLTPDLGEAHDEIEVGYSGEPFIIGFNANYLIEVLRYIETEEVKIGLKAPERAATIEPVAAGDTSAMDYLCLVMPLRLVD
jgi:DNA polymerase-3 subunit beta